MQVFGCLPVVQGHGQFWSNNWEIDGHIYEYVHVYVHVCMGKHVCEREKERVWLQSSKSVTVTRK